jgi:hypothetical protein
MDNKSDFLFGCLIMIIVYAILKLFGWVIFPKDISTDYTKRIVVDSSEKVEQAISNAVQDVKKRDFIVIGLDIKTCDKNFIIKCYGKEKGNLLSL